MVPLSPADNLTRFIDSKHDFNSVELCLKSCVFAGKHPEGFSTFKITGLGAFRIWWLGTCKGPIAKPILARFDLQSKEYAAVGLAIRKSPPNARHFDVDGFPVPMPPPPPAGRAKEISKRQQMVNLARVHISPGGLDLLRERWLAKSSRGAA
jgi:hypothetical protein